MRTNRKPFAVIGANDFQAQLVLKAKSLGYETHCFAWEEDAVAKELADYFYPISITDKDAILDICRELKPVGVCSIASDLAILTANYVSEKLGLPCNSYADTVAATNKFQMRRAFAAAGVQVPKFALLSSVAEADMLTDFTYPLIVKPTDRSGSRCITKIQSADELPAAVTAAAEVSFEHKAIVEEYIDGEEYSCECISYRGEHHFLALTKKYTTGSPHYIETGHRQPSDIPENLQPQIIQEVFRALSALNIQYGASHSEFKLDAQGHFRIIEIGPRMGGDCIGSDLVYLSTGHDFMKMVIDVACGNKPEISNSPSNATAEIRFLFTQEDLDRLEELKNSEYADTIYRISKIEMGNLGRTQDSSSRLGYYIQIL